jgi:hypothetical protein
VKSKSLVIARAVLLLMAFAGLLAGQRQPLETELSRWAKQIEGDVALARNRPTLSNWTKWHAAEKVELASYVAPDADKDQVDYTPAFDWCAMSLDRRSPWVRAATFYLPEVRADSLPPLPETSNSRLTKTCQLQAIWYGTKNVAAMDALVKLLSNAWGEPNGTSAKPDLPGSGLWKNAVAWHREGINIWVVKEQGLQKAVSDGLRMIIYIKREKLERLQLGTAWLGSTPEIESQAATAASELAARNKTTAREMLTRANCDPAQMSREDNSVTTKRLAEWLADSKTLPPAGRSAALLIADIYTSRIQVCGSAILNRRLRRLGAQFGSGCPQDGPGFSHNFRDEAERLDPKGPGGELAALVSLSEPCSLKGPRPWPDLMIAKGEQILRDFGEDKWSPWVHFQLGRAYAAKLSLAYPDGDPEGGGSLPLSDRAMHDARDKAIAHFNAFLEGNRDSTERVVAWQEAWRLLSGLPPSHLEFGCGCE